MNEMDDRIRQEAVDILEAQLGRETARMYQEYYKDKDVKIVMASFSELLTEFVGPQKKQEIMDSMQKKYPILHNV